MSSMRYDAPLYAGKLVYGTTDVGVLGSVMRAATVDAGNGAGIGWNDWDSSADDGLKFRFRVISKPAALYVEEDGSLFWATPPDGSYSVQYEGLVSNVPYGTATATVEVGTNEGQGAVTFGAVLSAAAGAVRVSGAGATALGSFTGAGAGVVVSGIVGVGALTLAAMTSAASGTVSGASGISGAAAATLAAVVSVASGAVVGVITGAGSATLGTLGSQGAGGVRVSGQAAVLLDQMAGQAAGVVVTLEGIVGSSDVVLGSITQVMVGGMGSFTPARSRTFLVVDGGGLAPAGE